MQKETKNIMDGPANIFATLNELEPLTNKASVEVERTIEPIRESLIKRFPVLFLLLVTLGFVAVTYALEHIIGQYAFFNDHPYWLLFAGLGILIFTGSVYKSR